MFNLNSIAPHHCTRFANLSLTRLPPLPPQTDSSPQHPSTMSSKKRVSYFYDGRLSLVPQL